MTSKPEPRRSDVIQPDGMPGYQLPRYDYRTPPELSGGGRRYPVVVVGAGLVGLTAAADLGTQGIETVVLDEDNSVGAAGISSRGVCYAKRTLEIFDRIGITERLREKGVLWRTGRVFHGDTQIYEFDLQTDENAKHPPFLNIQQFYVEEYLVDRIGTLPSVDLRWRNKVVAVRQEGDGVHVEIDTPDGRYTLTCDYLIAADGGSSTVRGALGIPPNPSFFDDRWCIADLRTPLHQQEERRVWFNALFNGGGTVFYHRMADGVCRFDCQIGHYPNPDEAATQEAIHRRIRAALGEGADYELVWTGVWRFKHRMMESFVVDRVLFVGDAAHELPPFGARGGNSGIQDADNLVWKLAMVLRGQATPALLHSYDLERREAARENIRQASRSALFLFPQSPGQKLFRDAILELSVDTDRIRPMVNSGRMSVPIGYASAPLAPEADDTAFAGGLPPGSPAENGRLVTSNGGTMHLLDGCRGGFLAVAFLDEGQAPDPEAIDLPFDTDLLLVTRGAPPPGFRAGQDPQGRLFARYDAHGGAIYLLRPDGHVLARRKGKALRLRDLPLVGEPKHDGVAA